MQKHVRVPRGNFHFPVMHFFPLNGGELEVSMCGAHSCTVVLCHVQTEISVKLFDRETVWEVMYVGLVSLISSEYRNQIV